MNKKLYITTAIPYVNATPHIGNTLDYLLADIWARYQRQNGKEVKFSVGTDEHGNKVATKAKEQNLQPQAYTDAMYTEFQKTIQAIGAEPTDVIRTTEARHAQTVSYVWQALSQYIYKGKYEGWYCVGHEAFFTDKEATATNGVCPDHQQPYQRLSEENYFFKLSAFGQPIKDAIENHKLEIVPEFRKKEVLALIDSGLDDISISRPLKNLSWGIPVPNDPSQVIYVWIDALSNYLSVLGYPQTDAWREYWPADIQVIGKDIIRFHAAIWPAMLLALDLPLPKKLMVHGFINIDGAKISKTVGNTVSPQEVSTAYGVDALRYYLSRHVPTLNDGDFTWKKFESAYNNELGNELGNLVQRVAGMLQQYQEGVIGDMPKPEHDAQLYHDAMRTLEFNKAFDEIWNKVRSMNGYLESVKPWEIASKRGKDPDAEEHLSEVLAYTSGGLLQIADLLVPFLPTTAAAIAEMFETGVVKKTEQPLFPRIYNHTSPTAKKQ